MRLGSLNEKLFRYFSTISNSVKHKAGGIPEILCIFTMYFYVGFHSFWLSNRIFGKGNTRRYKNRTVQKVKSEFVKVTDCN